MSSEWVARPLHEVLTPSRTPVAIEDDDEYEQVTVRIKGRGLARRCVVPGSAIATKRQFAVCTGQLLVSKIDARNGGLGLVPAALDGAIVSGDFPAFGVNEDRCLGAYLDLYVKRAEFWDECLLVSEGSTNRVRLAPDQFLNLELDLPPLDEQKRIVETVFIVDRLYAALVKEQDAARRLREALWTETWERLLDSGAELVAAETVVDVRIGGTPSRRRPEFFDGGTIPWLKTGEISFNEISKTSELITEAAHAAASTKVIPADTVVMAMKGQGATRGRVGVLTRAMTTNEAVAAFVPREPLNSRFLFHWFWSQYDAIREIGDGTSQPNLNSDMVRGLDILRTDLETQHSVAADLDRELAYERQLLADAAALARFRSALVDELVAGTTRPPDPVA